MTQWYLKYVADDLPAAVMVAAWAAQGNIPGNAIGLWLRRDPLGVLMTTLTGSAQFYTRNAYRSAEMFISLGAVYTPEELHTRLGPESNWVLYQHPPFLATA